ncbi:MAG: hypothetical protein R6V01_03645 [Thermoplasmatota archaeon]
MSILVFDATTLIHLGKLDLLKLFKDLDHELLLPMRIYEEIVLKGKQKGLLDAIKVEKAISDGIIKVLDVKEGEIHERLSSNNSLSKGDLDVIELACSRDGITIIDESYGRAVCSIEKVRNKGSIWVLNQLIISRSITKEEAIFYLDKMIENGWYCSTVLYSKAIKHFEGRS